MAYTMLPMTARIGRCGWHPAQCHVASRKVRRTACCPARPPTVSKRSLSGPTSARRQRSGGEEAAEPPAAPFLASGAAPPADAACRCAGKRIRR